MMCWQLDMNKDKRQWSQQLEVTKDVEKYVDR